MSTKELHQCTVRFVDWEPYKEYQYRFMTCDAAEERAKGKTEGFRKILIHVNPDLPLKNKDKTYQNFTSSHTELTPQRFLGFLQCAKRTQNASDFEECTKHFIEHVERCGPDSYPCPTGRDGF